MKTRILQAVLAAAVVGAGAFFLSKPAPGGPAVGAPAPEFKLADLSGRSATLADYRGKVVLLDFWATWCSSCDAEMPALKELDAKFKGKDFALLGVSVDEGGPDVVARYAAEKALSWRILFTDRATSDAYRIFGLPTKFLVARDGTILRKYLDPPPPSVLESDIQAALDRRPS